MKKATIIIVTSIFLAGLSFFLMPSYLSSAEKEKPAGEKTATPDKPGAGKAVTPGDNASESPLVVGETVNYDVTWSGIPAGTVVTKILPPVDYKGNKALRLKVTSRSYKAFDAIYHVQDDIESLVDYKTVLPYFFRKRLSEGKREQEEYISFDQDKKVAVLYKKKEGQKTFKKSDPIKIKEGTHDPLSSLFYFRCVKMKPGQVIKMPVCTHRKVHDLQVKVVKREKKRLRGVGTWDTFHIVPEYKYDGIFIRSGRADIWVEAETKIPILMEVTLPIGFAEVRLSKVEYKKYDKDGKEIKEEKKDKPDKKEKDQ